MPASEFYFFANVSYRDYKKAVKKLYA